MQDSNTKVIITTPVLLIGGTEMHILNLLRGLMSDGYDVSVCCYYESDPSMVSQIEATSAKVILMDLRRSNGLYDLFVKLKWLFREMKPDIVHVQYVSPGLIPILAAKFAGIKRIFATVHQPGRPYGWKPKIFIRLASHLCDMFFCNSRSVEESWFGNSQVIDPEKIDSKRKHTTIYNGVDIERIGRIGKEVDREKIKDLLGIRDKKVIGVVGRLREEKGQATLLESVKTVIQELPDAVLVVIGDGPDRQYLEGMAKKLGIDSRVKWLGQKDHDEVLRLYSIMDMVVVPSLFEGFGLTAAEAMASGKPVVASDVDGLSELIRSGFNGLLVPQGNSQALAKAILELLLNPAKSASMGVRGRKIIEEKFSMARHHSTILAAYSRYTENLNRMSGLIDEVYRHQ
jgi:glycosyltransferase involved in cell wall biosynthesis